MDIYVARQPIFDKGKRIYGYELLFRDGPSNAFPNIDGDTATSKLLANSFIKMGCEQLSGGKRAFINFTQNLLLKKIPAMFPPESLVVEILEDVQADGDLISACEEMVRRGYQLALDDFVLSPELRPLVSLSRFVKLDFRNSSIEAIEACIEELSDYPLKFLAEKVETHEELQKAMELGCDYFQGYFFSKPEILKERDIPPSSMHLLQIMAEVNKEAFSFDEMEKLIARDVSLSYKLMRYMNSAFFKRVKELSSIKQAVVLLGESGIRRFVSLVIMAKLAAKKTDELVRASIIRARFCELLGKHCELDVDGSELFTLGLFSLIDAILDESMEALLEKLPLSESIKTVLVGGTGGLACFLDLARFYERGNWKELSKTASKVGLAEEKMPDFYLDAVGWADSLAAV